MKSDKRGASEQRGVKREILRGRTAQNDKGERKEILRYAQNDKNEEGKIIRSAWENSEGLKTEIWRKYERGRDYLHKIRLSDRTDKAHRFYSGDQWHGLKSGGEELPSLNFIKSVIKYKVSMVAQNGMTAVYSALEENTPEMARTCGLLGKYFARMWEKSKMDSVSWKVIKDAAIQGDAYLYFGEGADVNRSQIIDNVNIFFADEQSGDIQSQKYIIIRERRFIEDIIEEARENGIDEEEISLIVSDDEKEDQLGDRLEVEYDEKDGKCISLLYMTKKDGVVHIARSVKNLVYQRETALKCTKNGEETDIALKSYPIVSFIWDDKKGSGRGYGEVEFLIPNQIEINKTLARRAIAVKNTAYPMLAYAENLVNNPDELDVVGGKIAINNGNAQAVNQLVSYLNPAQISPDAKNLSDELLSQSRELAGAGDSATGSIDPTQASGTAIMAVRDQAALPLNEQVARYSQFVEDLAYLWFDLWVCYMSDGIEVEVEDESFMGSKKRLERIEAQTLQSMKVDVKVDVSKANPFSIYAEEQSLANYWQAGAISFEEMVEALPAGGAAPKNKLEEILKKRAQQQAQAEQMQAAMEQMGMENEQYKAQIGQLTSLLQDATARLKEGGGSNERGSNDVEEENGMLSAENATLKNQLGQTSEMLMDATERLRGGM